MHEHWHEEWTAKLSDFLDEELTPEERDAVESHLQGCAACAAVLDELKQVVVRARSLDPRPSRADLWPGIAERIDQTHGDAAPTTVVPMQTRAGWRVTFTLPQLAAASLLLAAMSGGLVWSLVVGRQSSVVGRESSVVGRESSVAGRSAADERPITADQRPLTDDQTTNDQTTNDQILPVSLADAHYDAAVLATCGCARFS